MKHLCSYYLWAVLLLPTLLFADRGYAEAAEETATRHYTKPRIFKELETVEYNDSVSSVAIIQDERIEHLIADHIAGVTERGTTNIQGYRVQVFSSNQQQTAKQEAFDIEKKMEEAFPSIPIYVQYTPPFWKVRIGNFREMEEATFLRNEILSKFPKMQGEVYPVRDQILVTK